MTTYRDRAFTGELTKILVVGVHSDRGVRGQFENAMARALRTGGAPSEASLSVASGLELTADGLTAAARTARADAVLVTKVVDVQTQDLDGTNTFVEYFNAHARYQDPLPISTTHTVRVTSALYVVESQTKVWAADSTAVEKVNLFDVINGIATSVTAQLRTDGIIR